MEDKNEMNTNTPVVEPTSTPSEAPIAAVETGTTEGVAPTSTEGDVAAAVLSEAKVAEEASVIDVVAPSEASVVHPRSIILKQYGIAFGIIVVMGVSVTYALEQQGRINTHLFDMIHEFVRPAPVAAVVNGVKISMADYEKSRSQLEQTATQSGADITNESIQSQIKTQALDVLVNTEILKQAATNDGVTVTDEQVTTRYDDIVKSVQGEENLQAKMAELGITKESLMKDIAAEILIQSFITKSVDTTSITIEEKDVQAVYDQANTNPDSPLPPLAQVRSEIESKLRQDQEQQLINDFIQKLRDEAKIEIKI